MKTRWTVLICILCALALTACSGGSSDLEEETPWYDMREEQEQPDQEGLTQFALAYHKGQSLDPILCEDGAQLQLATLLYEPLFMLDTAYSPQSWLCDTYSCSEDGLTYTFHIRQSVTFWDGSDLRASDVVQSLHRAMTSQRYQARFTGVRSITASGEDVVVQLTRANSAFPALLDIPIVKQGTEEDTVPVGTGPYLYITDGDAAYLAVNDNWWKGENMPLDRIELVEAKDEDTVRYLFTSHAIQLFSTDLTGDSATLTGSLDCTDVPTTVMQYIGIRPGDGPLSNSAVRRAVAAGIERSSLVEGYLSGHGEAAQFPISPVSAEYPEDLDQPYNYEKFVQELAAAGISPETPGEQLRFLVNSESSYKVSIATSIAQTLAAAGLPVTVETLPWEEYLAALAAGEFDLYYGEIKLTADWDVSALIGTGGSLNYGGWSNAETDTLLATCRTSENREAALYALCSHLSQQAPMIPVCFKSESVLTHSGTVTKLTPTASNVFYHMWEWEIQMAQS